MTETYTAAVTAKTDDLLYFRRPGSHFQKKKKDKKGH